MVKYLAAAAVAFLLVGCDQHYRYPCQDPANWNSDRCKKPVCEINRDCPEHVLKGTNFGQQQPQQPQQPQQQRPGVCK